MSSNAIAFERKLCSILQQGLPIYPRPFAEIAKAMDIEEDEVLRLIHRLKAAGLIRRICAIVDYRALGMVSTLITAHIPVKKLAEVAKTVNSLPGVSHNYLRDHHYNLWFTLQAKSRLEIESTLSNFSNRFGIDFHSLPSRRVFKLDVRFDTGSNSRVSSSEMKKLPASKAVKLSDIQKRVLAKLQDDIELTERPFALLCDEGQNEQDVLATVNELINKGVIRRIAAVVNHQMLGFAANILFVCKVPQGKVARAGKALSQLPVVSHCYERETFEGWPYNLFAMMHGRSIDDIQEVIAEFIRVQGIHSYQLLPTIAELKKQPVRFTLL